MVYYLRMAVPDTLVPDAQSVVSALGITGADESFSLRCVKAGSIWCVGCAVADDALLSRINLEISSRPVLATSCVWGTTVIATDECIAASNAGWVGTRMNGDQFLADAGLEVITDG